MKILFISHYSNPHIGGVEKHIKQISRVFKKRGHAIEIISESNKIKHPHIKYLGLLKIWWDIFKLKNLIKEADIVHIHDVFIWYLPFRFLYPKKKIFITLHGGQDKWPVPIKNIIMVKLAAKFTDGNICVGSFIPKYFAIESDQITYGGVSKKKKCQTPKIPNTIVWIGRLDRNTDLPKFLQWLSIHGQGLKTVFVGDGEVRTECEKYGKVTGFVKDPSLYLQKAETAVPVGYLSYLEAKDAGCKIMTFPQTPIKKDYWEGIKKLKKMPSWEDVANTYIKLWKI